MILGHKIDSLIVSGYILGGKAFCNLNLSILPEKSRPIGNKSYTGLNHRVPAVCTHP
jgi:hypothetical protein